MRAHVVVTAPSGQRTELGPGDLIGRSWCASLHVDDPRVSEAHAMVSLRGDRLRLLALRGRFAVDGRVLDEVDLAVGQRILLAPDCALVVDDVVLPRALVALHGDGLPSTVLHGSGAIAFRPEPVVVHPLAEDAAAWVWLGRDGWRVRRAGGDEAALTTGGDFEVRGRRFQLAEVPLTSAEPTVGRSAIVGPLRIVARYETVHLHRRGAAPVVLDGVPARLVSELVSFGVPVAWTTLVEQLWPGDGDAVLVRKRFDGALARLRATLRDGGVRTDLVRSNGLGQIELFLGPDDRVEDQL